MPTYQRRQYRRANNFINSFRRNNFATKVQHALGINDKSTLRQVRRAGNYVRSQFARPLRAQDIHGMGDYTFHTRRGPNGPHIRATAMGSMSDYHSRRRTSTKPKVTHLEKGEMCIQHSEYMGDLISSNTSGAFSSQNYPIQPASVSTFPWLSAVAINFQDYRFKKLIFESRPLVSESSSTSTGNLLSMGSVILATQYDSVVGPYTNKATMENSEYSYSAKPSQEIRHAVECNPRFNPLGVLYVSANNATTNTGISNSDIRMQNLGIFQAASQGIPGQNIDLCELWCHYEIELYKPQLNAGLTNLLSGHWVTNAATGAPVTSTPFGVNVAANVQPTAQPGSNLLQCTFSANGTITFPLSVTQGSFMIVYYCDGVAQTAGYTGFTAVAGTGLSVLQIWSSSSAADALSYGGGPQTTLVGTAALVVSCIVSINAPGAVLAAVKLTTTSVPTGGMADIFITPFNTLITT